MFAKPWSQIIQSQTGRPLTWSNPTLFISFFLLFKKSVLEIRLCAHKEAFTAELQPQPPALFLKASKWTNSNFHKSTIVWSWACWEIPMQMLGKFLAVWSWFLALLTIRRPANVFLALNGLCLNNRSQSEGNTSSAQTRPAHADTIYHFCGTGDGSKGEVRLEEGALQ